MYVFNCTVKNPYYVVNITIFYYLYFNFNTLDLSFNESDFNENDFYRKTQIQEQT